MKKSNKSFTISALILVLFGFMFTSMSVVFSDEKKAEDAVATADAETAKKGDDKKVEDAVATTDAETDKKGDDKKKKKKKGDEEEEPECE